MANEKQDLDGIVDGLCRPMELCPTRESKERLCATRENSSTPDDYSVVAFDARRLVVEVVADLLDLLAVASSPALGGFFNTCAQREKTYTVRLEISTQKIQHNIPT